MQLGKLLKEYETKINVILEAKNDLFKTVKRKKRNQKKSNTRVVNTAAT